MKVKDIMTDSVVSLDGDAPVQRAADIMKQYNVGAVPVCDAGSVIGIITDRDIALRAVAPGKDTHTTNVREIMSSNPVLGKPNMEVDDAARIMSERQIRRLPIVDNDNLVGMVSLGDIAVEPRLEQEAEQALSNISEPSTPEA
ncbi:CBS domain-containing protein [Clostridium sp. CX1]|uniref:CBS domain-containing protein n=1 Tax=Clostridium tanneri TaxID=3037988 RepID=A0ABU4JRX5_9CLOT|nr:MULTISPECIES: CBS domain-containing protein [unclassified Clostridium]MCT8975865.1 CBS domain-containing protein [Clostridium sp. CX1]MDW8800721.1 CBS domain-containing protein [Clostridium sp. A1-XYC3]